MRVETSSQDPTSGDVISGVTTTVGAGMATVVGVVLVGVVLGGVAQAEVASAVRKIWSERGRIDAS
jgi:ABC-type antimicrobial peptide transport system permease subunit